MSMNAVVIDNGSGVTKTGFAGKNLPDIVFPTVVGHSEKDESVCLFGHDAVKKREYLNLIHPIEYGSIIEWKEMEATWKYIETKLSFQNRPVLLTHSPLTNETDKQKMAEIMFGNFGVPSLCISTQEELSLEGFGGHTGFVLDIGYGDTYAVPIKNGKTLPNAVERLDVAGSNLTDYLGKLLMKKYDNPILSDKYIVADIKEKVCFVAKSEEDAGQGDDANVTTYVLPDAQLIQLGNERCLCPEALFNPELCSRPDDGLHTVVYNSVMCCDKEDYKDMFSNILICGGCSLFPGLAERLKKELDTLLKELNLTCTVNVTNNGEFLPWIGGSKKASRSDFSNFCVTKEQYEEVGPSIIERMF